MTNGTPIEAPAAANAQEKKESEHAAAINKFWLDRGWNGQKRNIYTCPKCLGHIVTADAEHGVTPFMLLCRATLGCDGMMESSYYRVWDQRMRADYVWRKPTAGEFLTLSQGEIDHVNNGGLLPYPTSPAGEAFEAKLRARLKIVRPT